MIEMKTQPYGHQLKHHQERLDEESWGLFWEQGTGKSKPILDLAAEKYLDGTIDAMLVVAPMGVHLNWISDEIPTHLIDQVSDVAKGLAWVPASNATKWHQAAVKEVIRHKGFAVLTIPVESFTTDRAKKAAWDFLRTRKVLFVLDEGITVKTPSAKRTISILAAGKYAVIRRLLNGTPTAGEPWDVYSQMKFLDDKFWVPYELDGIEVFRTHFGKWQTIEKDESRGRSHDFKLCVGYRRLDELEQILKTKTDRVLKEDVLDLPAKVYTKARFDLSPEQQRNYTEIKEEFVTWLAGIDLCPECFGRGEKTVESEGEEMTFVCDACDGHGNAKGAMVAADLAITRMLRLQQITCGYLPTPLIEKELTFHVFKENPRLERFMTGVSLTGDKGAIVWYRFQKDGDLIGEALGKAKKKWARYDGAVPQADRDRAKKAFQDGTIDYFIANPAAISMGVTLLRGTTSVYYSNSFNLVQRLQSEDRPHRIGQTNSCLYADLMANGTIDEGIIDAFRRKIDVSQQITGDRVRKWI